MLLESVESLITLLVQLLVWVALFASNNNGSVAGFNLNDLLTYTIISRLAGMIVGAKFAMSFAGSIQSGNIALNFIRPYPPRITFIFQSVGGSLSNLLTVGIPTLLFAIFLLPGMQPPASEIHFLFFLISMFSGLLICISLELVSGVLAFWRVPGDFMDWYFAICYGLLSGAIVPLWFFPNWLQTVARFFPFQAAFFIPVQIYMGQLAIQGILNAILLQLLWIIGLFVLQEILWRRGIKHLTILGG